MLTDTAYAVHGGDLPLTNRSLLELGRDVLARGLAFRFRARGNSMWPFIREGDVINLEPLGHSAPSLGDVLAFTPPDVDTLIVHRVVAVAQNACLLQGDNTLGNADGWIPIRQVLGRVSRVEREGRWVRFSLGLERILIAMLSRSGMLISLLRCAAWLARVVGVQ